MRASWLVVIVAAGALSSVAAEAQEDAGTCRPGDEFCLGPPPCYRAPDDPECNPDCTCDSPDYPECDPFCAPGDICDPSCANPCWDEFAREDLCSDPPPPCAPTGDLPFEFIDDMDGTDDGQIFALGNGTRDRACGTVRVDETAYYAIFDTELSESCDDQLDETGYLTVQSSCNPEGWAVERNAGDRFLVADSDNTMRCVDDSDCGAGRVCREGTSHGNCCVPADPVFMGTFLLVAGEDNVICINHWCPEWSDEIAAGRDFGFINEDCSGANSIHFQIAATAIACIDETTLQPCSWGCSMEGCLPDPCDAMSCDAFCMDGVCLDTNPCDDVTCLHGCVRGRCLQNRHARGPDADGDGYSEVADCDDDDPLAHPGRPEVCADGDDDDCDGDVDEAMCEGEGGGSDGGVTGSDGAAASMDGGPGGPGGGGDDGGCACDAAAGGSPPTAALWLLGLVALLRRRQSPSD